MHDTHTLYKCIYAFLEFFSLEFQSVKGVNPFLNLFLDFMFTIRILIEELTFYHKYYCIQNKFCIN